MTIIAEPPPTVHYAAAPDGPEDNWRLRSACANSDDINAWFPAGTTGTWVGHIEATKAVCRTQCPVIDQCRKLLEELTATIGPVDGIWAGTDENDRDGERRRERKAAAKARYNEKRRAAS